MPLFIMETQLAITSADIASLVYSLVFFGGVIGGWAFIAGIKSHF